jgi:hypothetical protein
MYNVCTLQTKLNYITRRKYNQICSADSLSDVFFTLNNDFFANLLLDINALKKRLKSSKGPESMQKGYPRH